MPTLVRGCKADPILGSMLLRVQACETLAYLIEEHLELQRLTSWNNQCLKILSACLNGTDPESVRSYLGYPSLLIDRFFRTIQN